jgi:hypothetical protein
MGMKLLLIGVRRWGRNDLKTLSTLFDELYVVDADPFPIEVWKKS